VLGALSAANATGQLVFLPMLASVVETQGWRTATLFVAGAAAVVFVLVLLFMRDRPESIGLRAYGQSADHPTTTARPLSPIAALRLASKSPAFWVLAGTFFICGASTNGLIGTHLIAACHDVGIPAVRSAQLLAMMGLFDIVGTTASGWLTDRYSSRHLLFAYYALRGISLIFLPAALLQGSGSLGIFAVFYGLDWIATVPPTVRLTSEAFGKENTGVIYGWIGASHQLGASLAALGAGSIRTVSGDYHLAFYVAGGLCLIAGLSFVTVGRKTFPRVAMVAAA
jgi:sugar phosphate permease